MVRPDASDTRQRILDRAEALFAERGFAGTAVRDIAREAGLTPASLYNHFESKQALYEAVLERGVRPLLELLRDMPGREAPPGRDEAAIDETIDSIMAHLARHPRFPRLVQHEALTGGAYLARLGRSYLRPLIEQGLAAMKRETGTPWSEEELPRVISAWLFLVFGHFTLAPVLGVVFEEDPLSPENLDRQTRFLRKLARVLMRAEPATRGPQSSAPSAPHDTKG